ncbi:hypothetical protein C8A05DRAFT_34797 [Staphylotrichum tortipilum]|uniref:Uncharacterized protein n=1 Tax=Staphylotrichum tortipilum TaxID=2831512 RepID=A0AAN6MIJ2_9PEZI|nr:hypothetical protein C8A05DRAFT_34797 [Staphylotrichum longicolle]
MAHLNKTKFRPHHPAAPQAHASSPSGSHASLPGIAVSGGGHHLAGPTTSTAATNPPGAPTTTTTTTGGLNLIRPGPLPLIPSLRSRESTRLTDRTDALWAEMQATLEAVELSAGGGTDPGPGTNVSSTARVFSPDHERKLDELRAAQIALAQAWARSEADEAIETTGLGGGTGEGAGSSEGATDAAAAGGGGAAGGKSTVGTVSGRPESSGFGVGAGHERGAGAGARRVEEETEVDILLARKRREANDRYFQRVNQGVLDVVAKLEEVAIAMRAVEQESKELWGDGTESVAGSGKS